jgi:mRNA interferase MazF
MRRGEIYWTDWEPAIGSEANDVRPAVVVSNNRAAERAGTLRRGVVTVVPVTSSIRRVLPFHVLLPAHECNLPVDSKAQAEQVRALDIRRFAQRVGRVPDDVMAQIDKALRLHLSL